MVHIFWTAGIFTINKMRNQKNVYCFISDDTGKYYRGVQQVNGDYSITKNSQPYPISNNPVNLNNTPVEFGTNDKYFSLNRSLTYPLDFIKDGAAILRNLYHLGKGTEAKAYLTIVVWNGGLTPARYELAYYGKLDFGQKDEDPKQGKFTVPCIDDSAWGILSNNDEVEYAIECNERNPKAIRVLFDGITLISKYTFQTVQAPIRQPVGRDVSGQTIPFVLINQDGDSSGLFLKSQNSVTFINYSPDLSVSPSWFMNSVYAINNVNIEGSFMYQFNTDNVFQSATVGISLFLYSSRLPVGQRILLYTKNAFDSPFIDGKIYKGDFNVNVDFNVGESLFLILEMGVCLDEQSHVTITPIVTNTVVSTKTIQQPFIAYGLRPLDLIQQLVAKATNGRYTINSNFFVENNKDVALSGDSLRDIPNSKIYSSFSDAFKTFDPIYYMALRTIMGQLWMEKATDVYKSSSLLIDIGNAIDIKIAPAIQYFANEIQAGAPDIDLRHPSGRLEFNTTNNWSLPLFSTKKKMEFITKYRLGCYDIQFLILDYQGSSTQDNSGDKDVYLAKITDEQAMAMENIETFENVTIDDAPLEPIIKSPLDNDIISFNLPIIRGIAPPGSNVNIYTDTVLDGGTTADSDGKWSYNIVNPLTSYVDGVTTGIHIIDATFTDESAPKTTINILIDTSLTTASEILYPRINSTLYNNLPLLKGVAQKDQNIDISLDGIVIASVTTDASCKWEYKIITPISNGHHILSINGAGTDSIDFDVDSDVAFPLITYIGSELDGFLIINNLPLIKGVAKPGSVVDLYLNYLYNVKLGSTIADANGDWSFQVVPLTYIDPISGIPVVVAPIQNGLNIISTSLVNHTVSVNVTGYKLSRPNYSSLQGVTDNTVFNTEYSPRRMLNNHKPLLAAIMAKQGISKITFQKSLKNSNLRTVLDGVVVSENSDIDSSSLGSPIALLEIATIKTKTSLSFQKALENFNNGGYVKTNYRGTDMYFLPIGSMKMNSIHADEQEWKLLMAPINTYQSLLNLYKNGLIINLMKNNIYHSDYNSMHCVTYNFTQAAKYNQKDIYDDWFNNRNDQWLLNPEYIQKYQRTEVIRDQIISNGVSNLSLRIYRCKDAHLIDTIFYDAVNPAPINPPEIVLEAIIDWSSYPPNQYFCVMFVLDIPVAIFERVETRDNWLGTILIESYASVNPVGAFFSTGFRTIIRVEGLVKKLQGEIEVIVYKDESGNSENAYANYSHQRMIRFGTARGLPDYLYLKIVPALILDMLSIEGQLYVLHEGEKIQPSDDVDGHPLYYYTVNLWTKFNPKGATFAGAEDSNREGVILVIDATAFGLPVGSLININIDNE